MQFNPSPNQHDTKAKQQQKIINPPLRPLQSSLLSFLKLISITKRVIQSKLPRGPIHQPPTPLHWRVVALYGRPLSASQNCETVSLTLRTPSFASHSRYLPDSASK